MNRTEHSVCRKQLRVLISGILASGLLLAILVGCSGGSSGSSSTTPATSAPAGTATLLPSVTTINATQADYVASQTVTTWTLRTVSSVRPGDVLLLQDTAVKVVSVDTSTGQMVLTVTPAQLQDVFSKLRLQQTLDLNNATFTPDPGSTIPATFGPTTTGTASLAAISVMDTLSLKIPYNNSPWTANLEFKLVGKVNLDYDSSNNNGITGTLDVTGIAQGDAAIGAQDPIALDLPELPLGTLYIPIRLSVVDGLLNAVGIRVASIQVPLSIGAKAKMDVAFGVGMKGSVQSQVITTYDATNGFSVSGPTLTGSLDVKGIPSATVPVGASKATVTIGPYVHARPQLLILDKVASIGADVTVGLYGKGVIQSILASPFYCVNLAPVVGTEASGFFKGYIPSTNIQTSWGPYPAPPVKNELTVGNTFLYPASSGESACDGVQFSASTYSVQQTAGTATITVTRTANTSAAATVHYATSDGTALAGRDYTATNGTLTFNPGDPSETFIIPILSTLLSQGGTVNLTLSQPSNTALGAPSTATLTISQSFSQFIGVRINSVSLTGGTASTYSVPVGNSNTGVIGSEVYQGFSCALTCFFNATGIANAGALDGIGYVQSFVLGLQKQPWGIGGGNTFIVNCGQWTQSVYSYDGSNGIMCSQGPTDPPMTNWSVSGSSTDPKLVANAAPWDWYAFGEIISNLHLFSIKYPDGYGNYMSTYLVCTITSPPMTVDGVTWFGLLPVSKTPS